MVWLFENKTDIFKAFFEVLSTVSFTFIPFLVLSVKWIESEGTNTTETFFNKFSSFWTSGEVALPVLGLCGAIAAMLALNKGYFSWWVHFFIGFILLFSTLGVGAMLTGSHGFDRTINTEIVYACSFLYGMLAVIWFLLSTSVRTTEAGPRDSGRSAEKILNLARQRREKMRGHE